jgi:hypothetical protein
VSTAIGFPRGRRSNPANDGHRASCGEPPGRDPRRGRGVGIRAARRGGNPGPTDTFLVGATLEPGTPRLLRKSWCPRRREARNPWKQAVPARRARDGDVSNLQVYRRDSGDGWPLIPLLSARCLGRVLGRPGRRPRGPAPRRAVPLRNRRPEIAAASVRRLNSAALARTLRREERSSRGEGDRAVSELHGRGSRRRSVPQVHPARAASWLAVFGGRRERPGPVPRWQHRAGRSST